jgi:hypothetical protein
MMDVNATPWEYEDCVGGKKRIMVDGAEKWVAMSEEERKHAAELWERAFDYLFNMSRKERIHLQGGRQWWWNKRKKRPSISNMIGQIVNTKLVVP